MRQIPNDVWGYTNEAFDSWLTSLLEGITEEERNSIPDQLLTKIFKNSNTSVNTLTDPQKDFILAHAFHKVVYKVVQDDENGMTIEDFFMAMDKYRMAKGSAKKAGHLPDKLVTEGLFIRAGPDLMAAFSHFNMLIHAPTFKLLMRARTKSKKLVSPKYKKQSDLRVAVTGIVKMIANYEAKKKRIPMEFGWTMPEWYLMLYFYDGEKKASIAYNEVFIYAYASSRINMVKAVVRLAKDGYLTRRGSDRHATYTITVKGKDIVDKILSKYILNY